MRRTARTLITVALMIAVVLIATIIIARSAHAQTIYCCGPDGRVHSTGIVGPDRRTVWPILPTFCTPGFGPCPIIFSPPAGPFAPLAYGPPVAPLEPLPPQPIGWIWSRGAPCADPDCRTLVVQVQVDGLNVRTVPEGPVIGALANGTPVIPLTKAGPWVLVAPACLLASTYTASITAGGVPLSVCL